MRIVPQGTLVTMVLVPKGTLLSRTMDVPKGIRSGLGIVLVVPKDTEVRGQSRRLGSAIADCECPNLARGQPTKASASRNRDLTSGVGNAIIQHRPHIGST